MSGRIINTTPLSGEFPEICFGEHFRHCQWVEFEDNECQKWIGCFPCENPNGFNEVLVDKNNHTAFVVSGGVGYLIDINKRTLKHQTEELSLIESVILTENPDYFIAGTFFSVYVLDAEKMVKEVTPDIVIDGIYFKSQHGRKAIGDLSTAENHFEFKMDFEFDLESFELTLNKKVVRKKFGPFESIRFVDKDLAPKPGIFKRFIDKLKRK